MIEIQDAILVHELMIEEFGGGNGVRDKGALESALARPFATFDGEELLPTPGEKAGALIESILINHPFVDGNKRTGYVLMRLLLLDYGFDIQATENEKYKFVIGIASGQLKAEAITNWVRAKLVQI